MLSSVLVPLRQTTPRLNACMHESLDAVHSVQRTFRRVADTYAWRDEQERAVRDDVHKKIIGSAIVLLLAGCSGNGMGLDENGRPAGEPSGPLVAEFSSIQDHIFTPRCTGCHAGAGAPLGLRLTEDVSYAALVNTPSVEQPSLRRVAPGDPSASYLLQKISGTAAVGDRMPLGVPPLSADMIAAVRQWITDGALAPTAESPASVSAEVTAVSPMQEAKLSLSRGDTSNAIANANAIVIATDVELDASSVDTNTISLVRSGGDDSFLESNEVTVSLLPIELRSLSPTVLAVTPSEPWIADRYRLTLSGSGQLVARDLRSQPIDGDGDGQPGGDFVLEFVVTDASSSLGVTQ